MTILIYLFGVFLILAGFLIIIKPDLLFNLIAKNVDRLWMHVAAVATRIILGGVLIYSAEFSRFPLAISILGWITLIVAVILLVMGRGNFERLISWVIPVFKPYARIAGLLSAGFGGFLIYAFI